VRGSEFITKAAHYMGDSKEIAAGLNVAFCDLRGWFVVRAAFLLWNSSSSGTAKPNLEQPSEKMLPLAAWRFFSREISYMQGGQCGNQEAHAEVLCRRRRTARAIPARDNLPPCDLSRQYLFCSKTNLPSRAAASLGRDFLPQAQAE
jgi:hypothetical protein